MHSSHCQVKPFAQCAGSRAAARQARADAGGRRTGHRRERQGLADLSWCALASVIWSSTRTKTRCRQTTRVCNTLKFCNTENVCTVSFGYSPNTENVCTVSFGRPRSDASAHPTGQLVPASLACGPCAYPPRPPAPAARLHGCLRNLRPASDARTHRQLSHTTHPHAWRACPHTALIHRPHASTFARISPSQRFFGFEAFPCVDTGIV